MKTVLESIDQDTRHLARHPLFTRLRDGDAEPRHQQQVLIGMARLLAELAELAEAVERVEHGTGADAGTLRPLPQRLADVIRLARDDGRPAVLHAVAKSGQLVAAYLDKLCECPALDPDLARPVMAAWEPFVDRLRIGDGAEAASASTLDESTRQKTLYLVDAVFELIEGRCDEISGGFEPDREVAAAAVHSQGRWEGHLAG